MIMDDYSHNRWLIDLMKYKQEILAVALYINEKDEKAIYAWKPERAFAVRIFIEECIASEIVEGLSYKTCPFCIYHRIYQFDKIFIRKNYNMNCSGCDYKKRHGKCNDSNSDFSKIKDSRGQFNIINNRLPRLAYVKIVDNLNEVHKRFTWHN